MLLQKTTQRLIAGWVLLISNAFFMPFVGASEAKNKPFVSLTLCSDRLLMALAEPSQIAALSPFSRDPQAMLNHINTDKPIVNPKLSELLHYRQATLLINETFYPQLVTRLRKLGFVIIGINDNPQTPQALYALIRQLGHITGQQQKAEQLITNMPLPDKQPAIGNALFITENGTANTDTPQFQTLMQLIRRTAAGQHLAAKHHQLSPEHILLANPQSIIRFRYSNDYSHTGQYLSHPALQQLTKDKPTANIPVKYTYCFDHGVWQGAKLIKNQL